MLEARDRVGGRTWTKRVAGAPVDFGGQWVGPQQERIVALAEALGIPTFETYNTGLNVFFGGGAAHLRGRDPAGLTAGARGDRGRAGQLNDPDGGHGAAGGPVDRSPGRGVGRPDGGDLEARQHRGAGRGSCSTWRRGSVFACEPRTLLRRVFASTRAASRRDRPAGGGARERRLVGGAQLVSRRLAAQLGRAVLLRSTVREIEQARGGGRVGSRDVRAERCVVTVPPALAERVDYDPPLPRVADQLTQRLPMGIVIKTHAVYDRPFWRDDGLTGRATSDLGPVEDHVRQLAAERPAGRAAGIHRGT